MALFGSKKKKETSKEEKTSATKAVAITSAKATSLDLSKVIKRPRITEKASFQAEKNIYTFEVGHDSTKKTISLAVQELYKVTPVKVTVVRTPSKKIFVRGKWGIKQGGKKAYVFLKKGETIEFV